MKISMKSKRELFFSLSGAVVLGIVIILTAFLCPGEFPPGLRSNAAGTLVRTEKLGRRELSAWQRTPHGPTDVELYRLVYWTTNYDGAPVEVSGLLVIPPGRPLPGVVSYQHGTITDRKTAPSYSYASGEGGMAVFFAGAGFLVTAADYIGLGLSQENHPYLNASATGNAVVDLLKAVHEYVTGPLQTAWPQDLFLSGVSQGGYSTMAAHRALDRLGDGRFRVTASAPLAGPYHLSEIAFPYALEGRSPLNTALIAYAVNSYSIVSRQPLESIVIARYARVLPGLFNGARPLAAMVAALPDRPADLFLPEAVAEIKAGKSGWFPAAMRENELFDWTPAAPVRLYYGDADTIISPRDAPAAARKWSGRGGKVEAVSIGDAEHDDVGQTLTGVRSWFLGLGDKKTTDN